MYKVVVQAWRCSRICCILMACLLFCMCERVCMCVRTTMVMNDALLMLCTQCWERPRKS
jgi:hypothetical protein